MGSALLPIVIVVGALMVGALIARRFAQREVGRAGRSSPPEVFRLRYRASSRQESVDMVHLLRDRGFAADHEEAGGEPHVVVAVPTGEQDVLREQVREAIAAVALDDDPDDRPVRWRRVRFVDE